MEAVSVGISPPGTFAPVDPTAVPHPRTTPHRSPPPPRQLSQDLLTEPYEEASTTLPRSFVPPRTSSRRANNSSVHPFVHISKHTHSAILWAVEEALRHPNPFTPDLDEENADMSDLRGAGGLPAATNAFGSPPSRPTAPPSQTGSPSGIKGPKKIMEERNAREERKRQQLAEERERLELERVEADQQNRQREELQRRQSERRAPAASTNTQTGMPSGGASSLPISTQPIDPTGSRRRQQQAGVPAQAPPTARTQTSSQGQSHNQPRIMRIPSSQQPQPEPQTPLLLSGIPNAAGSGVPLPGAALPGNSAATGQPRAQFPHAFERWEALSAHWEGLTSFWIRKLQQHAEEIDRDPLSSQLSRQVTDLSAAGANLFHAVVELQRLRASSERKFQRWFFETRAELERHEETKAMLERTLAEERMSKAAAIKEAVDNERNNSRTQKRLQEMQKELQISKDEARRAWEELGRREQEERDRTISLQQGLPTIVGGVQVVPMTQGVPSRGNTQQPEMTSFHVPPEYLPSLTQPTQYAHESKRYNLSSPGPPSSVGGSGGGSGGGPSSSGGYYEQSRVAGDVERPFSAENQSEGAYSAGEYLIDAQGKYVRDEQGNKIPYPGTPGDDGSDSGADEYETPSMQPAVSYPPSASQFSGQPGYSGDDDDYSAPSWETMPRHHHPTRLSDVLEEEETRSRTSAGQSQVQSQVSRR